MDLFTLKPLLLLLFFTGCCAGQDILPEGPVEELWGQSVILRTLVEELQDAFIIWTYGDGKEAVHIGTLGPAGLQVNPLYKGRASINPTNGYLTLGPLKMDDSGVYRITLISDDGRTRTGETRLIVLSPDVLPESLVEAHLGEYVTLKTLLDKPSYAFIIWNYSDGNEQEHIATVSSVVLKVNTPYEGRVWINPTSSYLILGPLKMEDSGVYSINIIAGDGTTETSEIQLRVLNPPETTEHRPGLIVALIVCAVVIVVLLAGYPLLYKWMKNKRPSNERNVELSANNSAY